MDAQQRGSTSKPKRRLKTRGSSFAVRTDGWYKVTDSFGEKASDMVFQVALISPLALRDRLERAIEEHGEEQLTQEKLLDSAPSLYWNLVWYCARLRMPLPLISSSLRRWHGWAERIFVGWDPARVVAAAKRRVTWVKHSRFCQHTQRDDKSKRFLEPYAGVCTLCGEPQTRRMRVQARSMG